MCRVSVGRPVYSNQYIATYKCMWLVITLGHSTCALFDNYNILSLAYIVKWCLYFSLSNQPGGTESKPQRKPNVPMEHTQSCVLGWRWLCCAILDIVKSPTIFPSTTTHNSTVCVYRSAQQAAACVCLVDGNSSTRSHRRRRALRPKRATDRPLAR